MADGSRGAEPWLYVAWLGVPGEGKWGEGGEPDRDYGPIRGAKRGWRGEAMVSNVELWRERVLGPIRPPLPWLQVAFASSRIT